MMSDDEDSDEKEKNNKKQVQLVTELIDKKLEE